jgi:type II secretory ATPase GspE/PulE/Tfp pilus assembly ATPase PilB-like protein
MGSGTGAGRHWRRRWGRTILLSACIGMVAGVASAQGPDQPENAAAAVEVGSVPGGAIAILPLVGWWLLVVCWVGTCGWVSSSSQRLKFPAMRWVGAMVWPFVVAALAAWWIPWSAAGLGLMGLTWIVPALQYVSAHNKKSGATERVLTAAHLGGVAEGLCRKVGVKVKLTGDGPAIDLQLPDVRFVATCGEDESQNKLLLEKVAELPGFEEASRVVAEAVAARVPTILLDATPNGLVIRHDVDGVKMPVRIRGEKKRRKDPDVWTDAPPFDPATGENILMILLRLAGLSPKKRGRPQEGNFSLLVDGKQRKCTLTTRMLKSHEQFALAIEGPLPVFKKLADLGMSKLTEKQLAAVLAAERGLLIVSAAPGSGLDTFFDTVLLSADRLMRDFVSIEERNEATKEIQNVKVQKYDAAAGETPVSAVEKAALSYPSGFVTRRISDADLARDLVERAVENKLVIVSLPAVDSIDAIERFLALGVPHEQLARCLLGSVCQRLLRRLCPRCAEAQPTPPPLLEKFGMAADEVPEIKAASPHGGCIFCSGRAYIGRIGSHEMASGATLRKAVARRADAGLMKKAAAQDGMLPLREEAMPHVFSGTTSLDEVQRVLAAKKKTG